LEKEVIDDALLATLLGERLVLGSKAFGRKTMRWAQVRSGPPGLTPQEALLRGGREHFAVRIYHAPNCLTLQFATLKLTPKGTKTRPLYAATKDGNTLLNGTVYEEEAFPEIFSLSEFIRLASSSDPAGIVSGAELS
jgi:hypothetical protein